MSPRTRFIGILLIGLSVLLAREISLLPDGHTHLYFLDVGQGDSALIVSPSGHQILIDGGPDFTTLERLDDYMPFLDRSIDLLVLSHPHIDHIASFPEILKRYHVGGILFSATPYSQGAYEHMLAELKEQGIPIIVPDTGKDISLDDGLRLQLLWPTKDMFGKEFENVHTAGVALRLTDGTHSALFTGDLEIPQETKILASGRDVRSDILKVGHHGSLTSTSTGFLLAIRPTMAVISSGEGNSFGHPRAQILERLRHFGIEIRRTDLEGTVEVEWK